MSYSDAEKRCAAYQEDGYPAGRWRVPTKAEVKYIIQLSGWGVIPVLSEQFNSTDVLFYHAVRVAKDMLNLDKGDKVVMTGGLIYGEPGNTNIIKVETI